MGFLKKMYGKYRKYEKAADKFSEERQQRRIKHLRSDVAEEKLKTGVAKAKHERQKYAGPGGFNFGGFAGPTQKKKSVGVGVADYLTGGGGGRKKKTRSVSDELNDML